VRLALGGILDTAIEAKKLLGELLPTDPPMAMRVDGHTVWYALDVDRPSATIPGGRTRRRRFEPAPAKMVKR